MILPTQSNISTIHNESNGTGHNTLANVGLPSDPAMLLSYVNMRLRDEYASLDELCSSLDIPKDKLTEALSEAGFEYSTENNKFW